MRWGVLGGRFEASLGPVGASRRSFGASWMPLEASLKVFRRLALKRVIFSDFERIFGGLGDVFWV